jgi:hypothetical protein
MLSVQFSVQSRDKKLTVHFFICTRAKARLIDYIWPVRFYFTYITKQ